MSTPNTSQEPETTKYLQLNFAGEQRNAARDYYDYSGLGSIKVILATQPKSKLDELALANSRMFYYRFGFEPPEIVRKQVLDIQNKDGYSDHQVRWLRHAGQLDVGSREAKIKPIRFFYWFGRALAAFFALSTSIYLLVILVSNAPAWKQALGNIFLVTLCFGSFWIINKLYIAPWHWLKHAGALPSQKQNK